MGEGRHQVNALFVEGFLKTETIDGARVPDVPREFLDNNSRIIPGDGVAPVDAMLRKLADKGYTGPLSVELFLPRFQMGDPNEVAREILEKCEAVMRKAAVL